MMVHRLLIRCAVAFWFILPLGAAQADAADKTETAPVILVMGDSLSAGYGVAVDATWVALLQKRLSSQGYGYKLVNASVSGETTGGALARLARALELHRPAVVILELGGNDGLRGLPVRQIRSNLDAMLDQVKSAHARAVLVAMRIPGNYGPTYTTQFHDLYTELAKKHSAAVVNGFIETVALNEKMMQADGIHPNTQAQPELLDAVWPTLLPLLRK